MSPKRKRRTNTLPQPKVGGKVVQNLYKSLLKHRKGPAPEGLIHDLHRALGKKGISLHPRTLKRQLEGQVASVPEALEIALGTWMQRRRARGFGKLIKQWEGERKKRLPEPEPKAPGYVTADHLPRLVESLLKDHPYLTRRQLALLLREDLKEKGTEFSLNTLQYILAGKTKKTRPVVLEVLTHYTHPGKLNELWVQRKDLLLGKKGRPTGDLKLAEALARLHQASAPEKKQLFDNFLEARQELIRKRYSHKYPRKNPNKSSRSQSLHDILNDIEPMDPFAGEGTSPEDAVVAYDVGTGTDRLVS